MTSVGDPAAAERALDAEFAETVRRTGASLGALYLLAPGEQVLWLDVLCASGRDGRTVPCGRG
ncbi:hypothetical protein [Streptomyces sp. NPDC005568]|uniref:hypothetical protein n=1 Tax=Streptomyces sp. NPDC005568 TaxID=3156887 RepID=UPI0033B83307